MKAPVNLGPEINEALKGAGAVLGVQMLAPGLNIPYKGPIVGYIFGGVPGAIAGFLVTGGLSGSGSTGSAGGVVLN